MRDQGLTRGWGAAVWFAGLMGLVICGCTREAPPPVESRTSPGETAVQDQAPRVDFATFHASGELPCAVSAGQPMGPCAFGVRREGGGNAIVTVMPAGGPTRTIYFENGEPAAHANSQSEAATFEGRRDGRLFVVTIGPERYEIPDIVVFGDQGDTGQGPAESP